MTDDEFMQMESQLRGAIGDFKEACDEKGMDFSERIADIVFDIDNDL